MRQDTSPWLNWHLIQLFRSPWRGKHEDHRVHHKVPFVDQLKFDYATKRLIRDGVRSEINPFDKGAIAQAVELRKQFGGEAIVITMGPPQAKDALIEALAMGSDRAVHLLGKERSTTIRTRAFSSNVIMESSAIGHKWSQH